MFVRLKPVKLSAGYTLDFGERYFRRVQLVVVVLQSTHSVRFSVRTKMFAADKNKMRLVL